MKFAKEMTDLVPVPYADIGVLVQDKYGIENKDPYIYLTKGKISRGVFLKDAVVKALVRLD